MRCDQQGDVGSAGSKRERWRRGSGRRLLCSRTRSAGRPRSRTPEATRPRSMSAMPRSISACAPVSASFRPRPPARLAQAGAPAVVAQAQVEAGERCQRILFGAEPRRAPAWSAVRCPATETACAGQGGRARTPATIAQAIARCVSSAARRALAPRAASPSAVAAKDSITHPATTRPRSVDRPPSVRTSSASCSAVIWTMRGNECEIGLRFAARVAAFPGGLRGILVETDAFGELAVCDRQVGRQSVDPVLQVGAGRLARVGERLLDPAERGAFLAGERQHRGLQRVGGGERGRVVRALADLGQFLDRRVGHGGLVERAVRVAPGGQECAQVASAARARRGFQRSQAFDHVGRRVAVGLDVEDLAGDGLGRRGRGAGQCDQRDPQCDGATTARTAIRAEGNRLRWGRISYRPLPATAWIDERDRAVVANIVGSRPRGARRTGRSQPVLRSPAAIPLMDRWIPRCRRSLAGSPSRRRR